MRIAYDCLPLQLSTPNIQKRTEKSLIITLALRLTVVGAVANPELAKRMKQHMHRNKAKVH